MKKYQPNSTQSNPNDPLLNSCAQYFIKIHQQ